MNLNSQSSITPKERQRDAFRISLGTGLAMAVISLISLIFIVVQQNQQTAGVYVTAIVSVAAFISAFLIRREKVDAGIWFLLVTLWLVVPVIFQCAWILCPTHVMSRPH